MTNENHKERKMCFFAAVQCFAHRGDWTTAHPENSLGAFARAARRGVGVECDVRMSSDGTPVVFHDAWCTRMTGARRAVGACTTAECMRMRLARTGEPIPTLEAVLAGIDGRVPILIEIKTRKTRRSAFVRSVARILRRYRGAYGIASFDPFLARAIMRALPHVMVGVHISDYPHNTALVAWVKRRAARVMYRASGIVPDFFVVRATYLERYGDPRPIKARAVPIITWGVADDAQWRRLRRFVAADIAEPQRITRENA